MDTNTTLGPGLDAAGLGAQYDAACKRLLSEKSILAWILKECVAEYHDVPVEEIEHKYIEGTPQIGEAPVLPDAPRIQGSSTEDASIQEGTVTYDIRFRAAAPKLDGYIELLINLEAQNKYNPGYPLLKRGLYYCSRMISSQYGVEFAPQHFEGIKKVYSIWICMNPPASRENTISRYRMKEEPLVGSFTEKEENYDLLTVLLIHLGDSGRTEGLLRLLDVLLSSEIKPAEKKQIIEEEFSIPASQSLEQEVSAMCNLSEGVWEKGIEKGMEKGIEKGIEKGRQETILATAKNLMKTLKLSVEQAMDAMDVPQAERPKYAELLKEQA